MNKKLYYFILMGLSILILIYFYNINIESKEQLTKNSIFDMIDSIDNMLLSCITKNGKKELSEYSKMDFAIRYIIDNRDLYKEHIILSDNQNNFVDNGTVYYSMGKVDIQFLQTILDIFFVESNLQQHKFENNNLVNLYFEPMEYIYYDEKNLIDFKQSQNEYIIYIEYTRTLGEFSDKFCVKYILIKDTRFKIVGVTICD